MHRQETIDRLTGVGRILRNGASVAEGVGYRIDISREIAIERNLLGETKEVAGAGHIEGRLLTPVSDDVTDQPVVLELEDGRRWDCIIQPDTGIVSNNGGIS